MIISFYNLPPGVSHFTMKEFYSQGTKKQFHRFIVVQEHLLAKHSHYMNHFNHFGIQDLKIAVLQLFFLSQNDFEITEYFSLI